MILQSRRFQLKNAGPAGKLSFPLKTRFRHVPKGLCVALLLLLLGLSLTGSPARAAAPETLNIGFHLAYSANTVAQLKTIWGEVAAVAKQRLGIQINLFFYPTGADLLGAMRQGKIHLGQSSEYDLFIEARQSLKAQPVMAAIFFNMRLNPTCLFVKKTSPVQSVKELKGKGVLTYDSREDFFSLFEMLGQRPDSFFTPLQISPNAESSAYALALDQAKAAFISSSGVKYLEKTNPGVGKKIRALVCAKGSPMAPLFVAPRAPAKTVAAFRDLTLVVHKDPSFKKFHPLMRQLGFSVVVVSAADYQTVTNLFQKAATSGWDKVFNNWRRYAARIKP